MKEETAKKWQRLKAANLHNQRKSSKGIEENPAAMGITFDSSGGILKINQGTKVVDPLMQNQINAVKVEEPEIVEQGQIYKDVLNKI